MSPPDQQPVQIPAVLIGAGDGGIDELRPFVQDDAVQWALLRFELGEGSFKRQKILFLHINGDDCPVITRGRANQLTGDIKQVLRGEGAKDAIHASLEVKRREELQTEALLERVARFFITDHSAEYSVQWMLKEYERQLQSASQAAGRKGAEGGGASPGGRRRPGHQAQMIFTTGRDALKAVGEPLGPWNWVMLQADPEAMEVVDGGDDSIDGMQRCLNSHTDLVMFGLLRMGFGEGRLRRTKYVFVHASGSGVSAVARGRLGAHRSKMQDAMGQFATISVSLEIHDPSDLTLEDVIDRVRKAAIIDDAVLGQDDASKSMFTVEAFRQALAEEKVVIASFHDEDEEEEAVPVPGSHYTVPEAVQLMRSQDAPLNWALFGPNQDWIRQRKSLQAPPNVGGALVPSGGYLGAKRRATSAGPARMSATADALAEAAPAGEGSGAPRVSLTGGQRVSATGGERVSVTGGQRVSFTGSAQQRASSALPLGSGNRMSALAQQPLVPISSVGSSAAASSPRRSVAGSPMASSSPRRIASGYPTALASSSSAAQPAGIQRVPSGAQGRGQPVVAAIPTVPLPAAPCPAPGAAQAAAAQAAAGQAKAERPRLAGPLLKQSGAWLRGWQLRWFEVKQGTLRWWDSPEDAAKGRECKGCQHLVGMKVKMVDGSATQFTLETSMGKDKVYVFDSNCSHFVGRAAWSIQAVGSTVHNTRADWLKALEREALERRRVSSFQGDVGRALLQEALSPG